jgi:hypothetical protein
MMSDENPFTFVISLSILDHLGRKLYRSFATVLGEAISNSWDADADKVWIYIDKQKNSFVIKDDGDGMTADDFQNKFLKIGYSKRKQGNRSPGKRPYIGRKGIGKLALLSCADRITVLSKTKGGEYVGGVIDNAGLDQAITADLEAPQYTLGTINLEDFDTYTKDHEKGTIIYFDSMKEGIKTSLANIRKIIALYFRFSLLDRSFKIFVDDKPITLDDLQELADRTEFLWIVNNLKDPYISKKLKYDRKYRRADVNLKERGKQIKIKAKVKGFIASVRKPMDLKVMGTDERVGVDLFVNGRLRERSILSHIPTARVVESYLYGQIHFNDLDDDKDRFSTSREGVVAEDDKFQLLLDDMKEKALKKVLADWDIWRRKHREEGDPDNSSITKKERKAEELYDAVSGEYEIPKESKQPQKREMVDQWVDDLKSDARFNFTSYAECFVSENLVRKHVEKKRMKLSKEAKDEVSLRKKSEKLNMNKGNISIPIRKAPTRTSYLSMDHLANLVDKRDRIKEASLSRDADQYKPIRDALMHTALLTDEAKDKLTTVAQNITARLRTLLTKA